MRVPSRETPNHPLVIWTRRGEHGEEALARSSSTDTKSVSNTYAQSSTYPRAAFHPSENCTIFRGKSCIFPTVTRKLDERGGFLVSKTLSLSFFEKNFNIETMDNLSSGSSRCTNIREFHDICHIKGAVLSPPRILGASLPLDVCAPLKRSGFH